MPMPNYFAPATALLQSYSIRIMGGFQIPPYKLPLNNSSTILFNWVSKTYGHKTDDAITKSVGGLWTKVLLHNIYWAKVCLNIMFVIDHLWLKEKSHTPPSISVIPYMSTEVPQVALWSQAIFKWEVWYWRPDCVWMKGLTISSVYLSSSGSLSSWQVTSHISKASIHFQGFVFQKLSIICLGNSWNPNLGRMLTFHWGL